MANKYHFNTKDLLLIAVLSCLGGVMSTYVGYVGSTFSAMTGIPMGGQILSGLHIFWIILVLAIVNKKGSGALAGLLKGFVEFITGSHLGIMVIATSLLEGIFVEIGFWPFKKYKTLSYLIAGGLGAWANILITQTVFNAFPGIEMFGTLSIFSFISGVVFGGLMGLGIVRVLADAGAVKKKEAEKASMLSRLPGAAAIILLAFVVLMLALHFATPAQTADGDGISVSDHSTVDPSLNNTTQQADHITFTDACKYSGDTAYDLMDYKSQFVTITAVDTSGGNTEARNYTGLPLNVIVETQCEGGSPRYVDVIGKDGIVQTFNISDVRSNMGIILVQNGTSIDVVAQGFPSSMWVNNVEKMRQY